MVLFYGLFGVFADIALIFNLCLMLGSLSLLGATLTLPGIAGIALTMGMAVDANVLIYERIREEVRAGRTVLSALAVGGGLAASPNSVFVSENHPVGGSSTSPATGWTVTGNVNSPFSTTVTVYAICSS